MTVVADRIAKFTVVLAVVGTTTMVTGCQRALHGPLDQRYFSTVLTWLIGGDVALRLEIAICCFQALGKLYGFLKRQFSLGKKMALDALTVQSADKIILEGLVKVHLEITVK